MSQGEAADSMFIIHRGSVQVQISGNKVSDLTEKSVIGDAALLTRGTRTATVIATVAAELLKLTQQDYDSVILGIKTREKQEVSGFLRAIPFFARWPVVKLNRLSSASLTSIFSAGQIIYERESQSSSFYIIKEGKVDIQTLIKLDQSNRWPVGNHQWELNKLSKTMFCSVKLCGPGDFFGEMELANSMPRQTRAKAVTSVSCLVINREEFLSIFTHRDVDSILKYNNLEIPSEEKLAEKVTKTAQQEKKLVSFMQKKALFDCVDIDTTGLSTRDCLLDQKTRKMKGWIQNIQKRQAEDQAKWRSDVLGVKQQRIVVSSTSMLNEMAEKKGRLGRVDIKEAL